MLRYAYLKTFDKQNEYGDTAECKAAWMAHRDFYLYNAFND